MENYGYSIMWILILVSVEYFLVLISVCADLISGVRKARRRGIARRSAAFRRTVDKVARYYNALLALTAIDLMQMGAVFYLRFVEGFSIPLFPLFTLIGALGIAMIEVKSIFENAEDKDKEDAREAVALLSKLLNNKELVNLLENHLKN